MNPKGKGEASEAQVLARLISAGYSVSVPFGNNQRYDLIVDDNGVLLKVQVKTGNYKNGCIEFSSSSKNGFTGQRKMYHGEIDLFMVYSPDFDQIYIVPVESKYVIALRIDPIGAGANATKVRWAKDYKFDAGNSPGGLTSLINS